ncbi:MAG: hypothetical protein AAGI71_16150 [Bacteroidota bacterium]
MTIRFALVALLLLGACTSSAPDSLSEGTWTGTITPMNHPDRPSPITYEVRQATGGYQLTLQAGGGSGLAARDLTLQADTLAFTFNEPEAQVPLRCVLVAEPDGHYAGRCTDPGGQWARFTMHPPEAGS